jgi:hypothetical protein
MDAAPSILTKFSDSANTRFLIGNFQMAANAASFKPYSHTFGVDSNCPFYRIFAGRVGPDNSNAYSTTFDFRRGGTTIAKQSILWGDDAQYNATTGKGVVAGLSITPFLGGVADLFITHSQFAAACNVTGADTSSNAQGFICRWTAIADTIVLTSQYNGPAFIPIANPIEFYHGVVQQPFGSA